MGVNSPVSEPEFDLNSSFVPVNISEFLTELSMITDVSERAIKIDDYVLHLQEELHKVHAFKRELPLCMLLLNDGTYIYATYVYFKLIVISTHKYYFDVFLHEKNV